MTIQLPPQIEADLHAESAANGVPVAEIVAKALDVYLHDSKSFCRPQRVSTAARKEEMAWAAKPDPLYHGKWVVVEGRQVIASDSNARQAYDDARSSGISSPFLIYVSGDRQQPFAGGWLD